MIYSPDMPDTCMLSPYEHIAGQYCKVKFGQIEINCRLSLLFVVILQHICPMSVAKYLSDQIPTIKMKAI